MAHRTQPALRPPQPAEQAQAYSAILAVVAAGHAGSVIEAAQSICRGGSVISAKRVTAAETTALLGISVQAQPGKETVLILVPSREAPYLVDELNRQCGLHSEHQGVLFTMAVQRAPRALPAPWEEADTQ